MHQRTAGGSADGGPGYWHYVLKRLKEGKIRPEEMISHRLPFDRLEEGFHIMRDKTEDYGKVMGKMEGLV